MQKFTALFSAAVGLALLATGASAQQDTCGGIGAEAPWMGGDAQRSDIAVAPVPLQVSGARALPREATVARFTLSQAMEVRVEAAPRGDGDTVLELYDAAGSLILVDDDSGGGLSSRAELPLAAGTYCLAARGFEDRAVTLDLAVSRLEMPAITVGLAGGFVGTGDLPPFVGIQPCLPSTQAAALAGGPVDALLAQGLTERNSTADVPYYRFTLAAAQPLSIRAENQVADPYIYLFDGAGNLMGENDDSEGLNSRLDFASTPLAAGTYCIGMRSLSDDRAPVTLRLIGFDQATADAEAYAAADAAPIAGGYPVRELGALERPRVIDAQVIGGQAAFIAFSLDRATVLGITADEISDSDPWLRLFDGNGNLVDENDDANNSLNSEILRRLQPGRYVLGVRQYSGEYQGVIRIILQEYYPGR